MAKYPVFLAGQRVTAALLSSMLPEVITKPANTTRASVTAVADDPDLTVALAANATYHIVFDLIAGGTATGDFKSDWNVTGSTTPTGFKGVKGPGSSATDSASDNVSSRHGIHGFGTDISYGGRGTNTDFIYIQEWGYIITTTTGQVTFRWAQVGSDATGTILAAGSALTLRRIA